MKVVFSNILMGYCDKHNNIFVNFWRMTVVIKS